MGDLGRKKDSGTWSAGQSRIAKMNDVDMAFKAAYMAPLGQTLCMSRNQQRQATEAHSTFTP